MKEEIFDNDFLKRLEAIKQMLKKVLMAGTAGERVSRQKGGRVEFLDHRGYSAGDETRYIDWNLFGRTEKLYVKEFASEQSRPVYVLVDNSESMRDKSVYAKQLAVVMGYAGLVLGGDVKFGLFPGSDGRIILSTVFRADKDLSKLLGFVGKQPAAGRTDIGSALSQMDKSLVRKGLLILVSDLLEDDSRSAHDALIRFIKRGFQVNVMHVISEPEANPAFGGRAVLHDAETGESRLIKMDKSVKDAYQKRLAGYSDEWKSFSHQHDIQYFYVRTSTPLEDIVVNFLKAGGLLR
ncbi:MAG: DUF58 domain-containing protein [Candidatus Brocadiia bacterium]